MTAFSIWQLKHQMMLLSYKNDKTTWDKLSQWAAKWQTVV